MLFLFSFFHFFVVINVVVVVVGVVFLFLVTIVWCYLFYSPSIVSAPQCVVGVICVCMFLLVFFGIWMNALCF